MKNYKELLKDVNTLVFDYDGVLTDGTVILQESGEPLRTANVKDGYALQLAAKNGYRIVIISGGKSTSMHNRFKALNINDIFLGVEKKLDVFNHYIKKHKIDLDHVLYMGDDIPDYEIMKEVGIPVCPADAADEIKRISIYISHLKGGEGCARDVIEQVMKVQNKWMNDGAFHW
ncbi:MAG: HAD hydrolase family protein [Bacteroidetes bacterium]|nr:HAD hydrolase family protein [Bacteroidota bacterium]